MPLTRARHLPAWCLMAHEDGSYDLMRGNRPFLSNLGSRAAALKNVVSRHLPGERVFEAEPDGYRTELTRELIRSGQIGRARRRA